ncbi:MAG TPA: hypothetical protein VJZ32_03150 [Candidatus Bathyarchaeia archaeon]|nr:hypothetical protein [Candidatus Bathyarchaeia archaeon]
MITRKIIFNFEESATGTYLTVENELAKALPETRDYSRVGVDRP